MNTDRARKTEQENPLTSTQTSPTNLAVLSPEPLASRSVLGFQAHMNTSDSCPRSTVALLAGISIDWSTSMVSGALGVAAPPLADVAVHVVPW